MKKSLKKLLVPTLGAALLSTFNPADMKAEPPTISGFVDTQYTYNLNDPITGINTMHSYDNLDDNIRSLAHLVFSGSVGDSGYVIEVDAGNDAITNTSIGAGTGDDFDIQEAYMTHKWSSGLGLKLGKFVTYHGIEVIEAKDNPTITRGFLFGVEPFTHTGGVVTFAPSDKLDFAAGVVNQWDNVADNNDAKTAVAKATLNLGDPLMFTISGYHGAEQASVMPTTSSVSSTGYNRNSFDLTGVTKIIPNVALWFQGIYGDEENVDDKDGDGLNDDLGVWSGFTIQPVISISEKFSVGARYEYLADGDGVKTGAEDASLYNITVAPAYKISDALTARLEYRYDASNKKLWVDNEGVAKDTASYISTEFTLVF
jgi:hypothetical protein